MASYWIDLAVVEQRGVAAATPNAGTGTVRLPLLPLFSLHSSPNRGPLHRFLVFLSAPTTHFCGAVLGWILEAWEPLALGRALSGTSTCTRPVTKPQLVMVLTFGRLFPAAHVKRHVKTCLLAASGPAPWSSQDETSQPSRGPLARSVKPPTPHGITPPSPSCPRLCFSFCSINTSVPHPVLLTRLCNTPHPPFFLARG